MKVPTPSFGLKLPFRNNPDRFRIADFEFQADVVWRGEEHCKHPSTCWDRRVCFFFNDGPGHEMSGCEALELRRSPGASGNRARTVLAGLTAMAGLTGLTGLTELTGLTGPTGWADWTGCNDGTGWTQLTGWG